jgi:16S rRNA (cytosine967-C5)-methyltransferase
MLAMHLTKIQLIHTIACLEKMLQSIYPADAVLSDYFKIHRTVLGKIDRKMIADLVFGALRHLTQFQALYGQKISIRKIVLATLIQSKENAIALTTFFTPEEFKWFNEASKSNMSFDALVAKSGLPRWVINGTNKSDKEIIQLGQALLKPASLDLRVNTHQAKRDEILAILVSEGIEVSKTPYSPVGLRLKTPFPIYTHPLFLKGALEVQDEGSQIVGLLVEAKRYEKNVDFCAGAGGKTLQLGAQMSSTGRLYAFDTAKSKLNQLNNRLERSGLTNVTPQWIANERDIRIQMLYQKMDRVLVDAPCSSVGTLRRHPDLRYRQCSEALAMYAQSQFNILCAAAKLVKPDGRLVYATCSFLKEENEIIIERFLANFSSFTVCSAQSILSKQAIDIACGDFLHLTSQLHQTDCFFVAVLTLSN